MRTNLVSISQQFSGLPLDALIGGPLNATAEANAKMAITQTRFLLDTCFVKKGTEADPVYQPITIKMELQRTWIKENQSVEQLTTIFHLPLLTVIPLNALAVDHVNIQFDMEVNSSFSEETSKEKTEKKTAEAALEAKIGLGLFSAVIHGKVSYDAAKTNRINTHYLKSNSAKYTVNVQANQLPLPPGVSTLIDIFTKSIDLIPTQSNSNSNKPLQ